MRFKPDEQVWNLNLDQVEAQSGHILTKVMMPASKAGSSTQAFDTGNVLYSKLRPYLNKVVCPDSAGIATTELVPMRPDPRQLDRMYLVHYLRSPEFVNWVSNEVAGAKMPRVVMKVFWDHQIPLPPLPEQKRIAAILDAADSLRAKRREALSQLDDLLQATFLDLFGDPVTNPKGWAISSGDALSEQITVGVVVKPASYYQESGVPALRSLNVRANHISTQSLVYFSTKNNEETLSKSRIWAGDILLVRSGQPGTAAIVPPEFDGVNAIDILIFRPRKRAVNQQYLCHYFNSAGGKQMVVGLQRGQIQKHLNVGSLRKAPIPLPPMSVQQHFAAIVEKIETQKSQHRAHLAELDTLFASLQDRAFTGKL